MPLLPNILSNSLSELLDQDYPTFKGFPSDIQGVADNWATAINTYASAVIPVSTTASQAEAAFKTVMLGMSSQAGNGLIILTQAFTAYAAALALGMVGAGFVGTPPPAPINIAPIIPMGMAGASGSAIASTLTTLIDVWFRTGIAVPSVGGPPIIWS